MIRRLFYTFCVSITITGIICFFFMYRANINLQKTLLLIESAGPAVLPAHHIVASLGRVLPAVWSSLFLSLTAGLFISLVLCALVLLFHIFTSNIPFFFHQYTCAIIVTLTGVLLLGTVTVERSVFHRVRDYVLLPFPAGQAISDFYYTYSPYAAHAIAPPFQKQHKTCWIAPDIPEKNRLAPVLAKFGWFAVPNRQDADLTLNRTENHELVFKHKDTLIVTADSDIFFTHPDRFLQEYSRKTDSARHIRTLCAAGLFMALPLFFFLCLFFSGTVIFRRFLPVKSALFISGICIWVLMAGSVRFLYPPVQSDSNEAINQLLTSHSHRHRIEGLRTLYAAGSIHPFEGHLSAHLESPHIPERYWIAKNLGKSDSSKSIHMLNKLLADDTAIVIKTAIKSLTRRRSCDPDIMNRLNELITMNPYWYVQISAITALRRCQQ